MTTRGSLRVIGYKGGVAFDEYVLNTTSHSTDWGHAFSPFVLGPVRLYDEGEAQCVENGWQFSKVYPCHVDPKTGDPASAYYTWAKRGWESQQARRYPMGKGVVPAYSWWAGHRLGYIEARRTIFIPLYLQAVRRTLEFVYLADLVRGGWKIVLRDFDGYDHKRLGMSYDDVVNCESKTMGHAFVLAMAIEEALRT